MAGDLLGFIAPGKLRGTTIQLPESLFQAIDLSEDTFVLDIQYDHLSVFAVHLNTGEPLSKIPLFGVAILGLQQPRTGVAGEVLAGDTPLLAVPLGVIGTDHVGYASFDLSSLNQQSVYQSLRTIFKSLQQVPTPILSNPVVTLLGLRVLPFNDASVAFDALKEGIRGVNAVCLRMPLDEAILADRVRTVPLPSMQTPGLQDWKLSPGSFSLAGTLLIGEDGFETFLPTNLSTSAYRFRRTILTRITQGRKVDEEMTTESGPTGDLALAYDLELKSEWYAIGHSLGQVASSLPLAPGEKVQISIVDWSRTDDAARDEKTKLSEQLKHSAVRDQSISEAVKMVVQEHTSGSSFMAGAAGSGGATIPIGPVALSIGAALGLGGASSSNDGVRTVTGSTTRQIADSFQQASTALRELNSTVVIQAQQAESATAKTRVVANYNHSHAMTVLYYEVLRHMRVVTRPNLVRPAIQITRKTPPFTVDNVGGYRHALEGSLLDPSLKPGFDAITAREVFQLNFEREVERRNRLGDPLDDAYVGDLQITVQTGATSPQVHVRIRLVESIGGGTRPCAFTDERLQLMVAPSPPTRDPRVMNNVTIYTPDSAPKQYISANSEFSTTVRPEGQIRWKNVAAIEIAQGHFENGVWSGTTTAPWVIENLRINSMLVFTQWVLFSGRPTPDSIPFGGSIRVPVASPHPELKTADDLLEDKQKAAIARLIKHLNAHRVYYWGAIWRDETPVDRLMCLRSVMNQDFPLDLFVENELLDVVGDSIVLPVASGASSMVQRLFDVKNPLSPLGDQFNNYVEQLISLPSRGLFAEAKLGNSNASEVIDTTRFWDWQTSPIPDNAPPIDPASTGSRKSLPDGLTPTAFPNSIVNIVSPQSLPDPTGFSAASSVLSSLGQFKDMSGMKELGAFLQTLSNNATTMGQSAMKGSQTKQLLDTIRSAKELTPEQKTELIGNLLTGQVKQSNQPAAPQPNTSTPATPTTPTTPATPTTPTTPTSPPTNSGTPTGGGQPAQPDQPKKQPPAPAVKHSPKLRLLAFNFKFDTNQVMTGDWALTLRSNGEQTTAGNIVGVMDDVRQLSGTGVGNRLELQIPETFGGKSAVTVTISGNVRGLAETPLSGPITFTTTEWSSSWPYAYTINRADFERSDTFEIQQATKQVEFKVRLENQGSNVIGTALEGTAGLSLGIEPSVKLSGEIPRTGLTAEGNVKLNASGTLGLKGTITKNTTTSDTFEYEVQFKGRILDPGQISLKAI